MELHDYLRALRRRWRWVALLLVLCVGGSIFATSLSTPIYRATAQLFISTTVHDNVTDLAQGNSFTLRQVTTYADMVTAPVVLEPVIAELGLDESPEQLASRVSTAVPKETVLIDIHVSGEDPAESAAIANAVAEQFTVTVAELERTGESGPSPVKASVIRPAREAISPVSPNPLRNLALGLSLGLMLGVAAAVAREALDTRVTGATDVLQVTDRPVIGGIAFDRDAARVPLRVDGDNYSPRAEAFRAARTNLQFINAAERPRLLLCTSSLPEEGKSTTVANLALTLAASGATVCAVEADLRRPGLLTYLRMEGGAGLTSVLIGAATLDDMLQPYGKHLTVLGAGPIPPNPSELLGSPGMAALLDELRERFEYVLIDAPPLLPVTDAAVLSKMVDGTIVVVGAGVVRRNQLAQALATLEGVGAHVLGVLLNRLPASGLDTYSYYHQEYAHPAEKPPPPRRHAKRERPSSRRTRATRPSDDADTPTVGTEEVPSPHPGRS